MDRRRSHPHVRRSGSAETSWICRGIVAGVSAMDRIAAVIRAAIRATVCATVCATACAAARAVLVARATLIAACQDQCGCRAENYK